MNKLAKLVLLTGISTIMLCTNAFADENVTAQAANDINVQSDNSQAVKPEAEAKPAVEEVIGVVAVNVLNVRSGPSTNDEILGKLAIDDKVKIVAVTGNWYQIEYGTGLAYVAGEYVSLNSKADYSNSTSGATGANVVEYAKKYIGVPYQYGGVSPSGFDCSGFVKYVMSNFNCTLPHSSNDQYSYGTRIEKSNLVAGDLVFFVYPGSSRIGHVGIYVGDGNFIHSPKPGQSVKIDTLSSGYFANCYYGATRVVK